MWVWCSMFENKNSRTSVGQEQCLWLTIFYCMPLEKCQNTCNIQYVSCITLSASYTLIYLISLKSLHLLHYSLHWPWLTCCSTAESSTFSDRPHVFWHHCSLAFATSALSSVENMSNKSSGKDCIWLWLCSRLCINCCFPMIIDCAKWNQFENLLHRSP